MGVLERGREEDCEYYTSIKDESTEYGVSVGC